MPPVYENTTCGIEEFTTDSAQIGLGKFAILTLEQGNNFSKIPPCSVNDEIVIDGDELSITLHCPTRLDRAQATEMINNRAGYPICDGTICVPHLSTIDVCGCTLNEVQARIQSAYREQIPSARIWVSFKKRRDRFVQIIGSRNPMVTVDGQTRLSDVIAKAKLFAYANLFKSYVMRNGEKIPVDLFGLIHKGDESQNIVMQGGDQIFIANAADATVMVTGEIRHPAIIPIPYGFISLKEAIAMVGGIPFTGNKNCIYVIRGNLERPKIYSLAWKEITSTPNDSLLLMPGDIVVISELGITQWNRFIDQLQPSGGCMQTGSNLYEIIRSID